MRGVGEWGTGVVGDMLESAPSGNADGGPPPSLQSAVASTQRHTHLHPAAASCLLPQAF